MAKKKLPPSKLTDLSAADYNPRQISDRASSGLSASLDEFGDISGITFNLRSGNLVAGHQRINSLVSLYGNLTIKNDAVVTPSGEKFGVRFVDWPIEKEKAANITANNQSIAGTFTPEVLDLINEIKLSMPEHFERLNLQDITLLPLIPIDGLRSKDELDESLINGIGLNAYFKITMPIGEADKFDIDLSKLLRKYPNAEKEKRV